MKALLGKVKRLEGNRLACSTCGTDRHGRRGVGKLVVLLHPGQKYTGPAPDCPACGRAVLTLVEVVEVVVACSAR